jgi:hypothetical protein
MSSAPAHRKNIILKLNKLHFKLNPKQRCIVFNILLKHPKKTQFRIETRVARWFAFKPKIPLSVNFWRAVDWKMLIYFMAICYISRTLRISSDHMVHFVFIWYIFPVLVSCTKKNLATLFETILVYFGRSWN